MRVSGSGLVSAVEDGLGVGGLRPAFGGVHVPEQADEMAGVDGRSPVPGAAPTGAVVQLRKALFSMMAVTCWPTFPWLGTVTA
jgi:hypothetical protein